MEEPASEHLAGFFDTLPRTARAMESLFPTLAGHGHFVEPSARFCSRSKSYRISASLVASTRPIAGKT
jgi:hypothetical protein